MIKGENVLIELRIITNRTAVTVHSHDEGVTAYLWPPGGERCALVHPCRQKAEQRGGQQRSEAPSGSLTARHGCWSHLRRKADNPSVKSAQGYHLCPGALPPGHRRSGSSFTVCDRVVEAVQTASALLSSAHRAARGLVSYYCIWGRGSVSRRANENQTLRPSNHLLQLLQPS